MFKKLITILIIFGFLLPGFCFGQMPEAIEVPKTIDQAKEIVRGAINFIWNSIWEWFRNIWNTIWQEIEKRKLIIQEEFEKEKQKIKELPEVGKSFWERLKELIQF
jgi:hypothetical protein